MKSFYLESSAVLAWLLGQPEGDKVIRHVDESQTIFCSSLTLMETERGLIRSLQQKMLTETQYQRLRGILLEVSSSWTTMEISPEIKQRVGAPFPLEPVRTLDAIHLSTALEFAKSWPSLAVLSLDQRILSNLNPLGLTAVPL